MTPDHTDIADFTQAGLNLIAQALSIYDRDLRLVVSNRMFKEMFGFPDWMVTPGTHFEDTVRYLVTHGEYGDVADPEGFIRDRVEQARTFEPHYLERSRANGRIISVEGSPLPQGGWVAVYTDITSIKRQEDLLRARSEELSDQLLAHAEELARTNRALASANANLEETKRQLTEAEARIRLTAEMMPAHIARIGLDGRYTYSNLRLATVLPGRPSNVIGLGVREALGDEAFGLIRPSLERAFRGEANVTEFNHEGTGKRIRAAFTPDIAGNGKVRGTYVLSMDITEEAQARAAVMQTRKRELAAQLTSGLAHDFANLLTIILGLQSRLDNMALPAPAGELARATIGAARRGGALLDRIASISGGRDMRLEPVEVAGLIADTEALAGPTLPETIHLSTRVTGVGTPVLLDAGSVQDALLNLILNAKDAIGSAPGEITLTVRTAGETWLDFTVSDTGPGFDDNALEHALDPFFTTKGGEGSGLGLAMVYDHAKMAGGKVRLGNGDNGAIVTMRLPLRRADKPAPPPRLVLLVEDEDTIRESVRGMLTDLGHQVIEATSAEEAADLARIDGIGLVLSDIMLEGAETGDALVARLRASGLTAPMCLMSSLPRTDPKRAGAPVPVLSKPFDAAELAAFLATFLTHEVPA
ncbi:PAS-domain containing protein [Maritimibacter fusiformis]|uniref:PAS-domain containing protein n=1 Tax=Maritimibacter fusiformis TaxID=2603819 RepID=UPI001FE4FAF7|nr:PAS-domain containing protein [Maritimibacter fusiformis]